MNMWNLVSVTVAGYLIGSISFSRLIARWQGKLDQLQHVSFELPEALGESQVEIFGANRASMVLGTHLGLLVAALDISKAALPTLLLRLLFPLEPFYLIYAFMSLIGHNWPIYHRFRGGRGFSVLFGAFLAIEPLSLLIAILLSNLIGMVLLGHPAIAYMLWLPLMIPITWLCTRDVMIMTYAIAILMAFTISIIPEMRQVRRYRREGKYALYMQGLLQSSPRWRAMDRMTNRLRFWVPGRKDR